MIGPAGTGKAGMTKVATEALGRLTRHDAASDARRRPRRRWRDGVVALAALLVLLAGWVLWELLA